MSMGRRTMPLDEARELYAANGAIIDTDGEERGAVFALPLALLGWDAVDLASEVDDADLPPLDVTDGAR